MQRLVRVMVWALLSVTGCLQATAGPPPLPALGVEARATVSGLSSGGYMSAQFAVAYSHDVKGVGVVAGGPFDCSQGDVTAAETRCSCVVPIGCSVPTSSLLALQAWNQAKGLASAGLIDPLDGLKTQRVWLFSGGKDKTVAPANVRAVRSFYVDDDKADVPRRQVQSTHLPGAGHGMPVLAAPGSMACGASATPFINDCDDDAAGQLLAWLYADAPLASAAVVDQHLRPFDQTAYTRGLGNTGLDSSGYVYVPAACATAGAGCRVHVVFHGCQQAQEFLGDRYATQTGYNRWAEGSRIVILYPQVKASSTPTPSIPWLYNPLGCWDFWGYTQPIPYQSTFATRQAPQMQAVHAMIEALQRPH